MIYVMVEDKKDGLKLCNLIKDIYSNDKDIIVESFKGIGNIEKKLKELDKILDIPDRVIIVYDDIMENPIVSAHLKQARTYVMTESLKSKQYKFLSTISFELEMLMIDGMKYFANAQACLIYVHKIKELFDKYNDIGILTEYTKNNSIYNKFYEKIRKEKRNRWEYARLDDEEFEKAVTVESLSKELLKEIFRDNPIDRPLTECWIKPCCNQRKRCKLRVIDTYKITDAQNKSNDNFVKANTLISNSSYKKLAAILGDGRIIEYTIRNFLNDTTIKLDK